MTAAHCYRNERPYEVSVRAGTNYAFRYNKGQTRKAEQLVVHENFRVGDNRVQEHNDLFLIKLSKPFNINSHVQTIDWETVTLDRDAFIFGFGYKDDRLQRKRPKYLWTRNVTFIPEEKCQEMLSNSLTKSVKESYEICAEKCACHGDSGSPLVQMFNDVPKLVGMTSWLADDLYTCNTPPAVFLKVADFQDWLTEKLRDLETNNTITDDEMRKTIKIIQ